MLALLGLAMMLITDLPVGPAPTPVAMPHFPDALHAYVWRNWSLVPTARIAAAIGAKPEEVIHVGKAMGLPDPPRISPDRQLRSHLSVIRRNWHLLPYDQLLKLLDWTPEHLAYTLREDDFLYIKLGSLKPKCEPIHYRAPSAADVKRELEIASIVHRAFPQGLPDAPLFKFVEDLKKDPAHSQTQATSVANGPQPAPRFCYSYFALYGDPLLDKRADPYPEGYLKKLQAAGVNGVWLQGVLPKLAPFPWDLHQSEQYEKRLANLKELAARAKRHGIGIYLYLNEPRALPLAFFDSHPDLKGVVEGDHAALCTSAPEVKSYIANSIATICGAVPDLAGFFTITASENLTNCWSHGAGKSCPRCAPRGAAQVIAEVNGLIVEGIHKAGAKTQLIAWDWGWPEAEAEETIKRLPAEAALMSVSEWDLPIHRGGIETTVGEYSVSAVGPGPRAVRHWQIAHDRGLKTFAKIQAANSWEMSAVPYVPALANVAQHASNLKSHALDGAMLGWTLGGYPSPNLEVVGAVFGGMSTDDALNTVAAHRFGSDAAPAVVSAWRAFSTAFSEFPFHIGMVYTAPMQHGPANLLWSEPTGYHATMVGFPYDDLDAWRAVYPPEIFTSQLNKIAEGFYAAIADLKKEADKHTGTPEQQAALRSELGIAETVAIHCKSVANQAQFVLHRNGMKTAQYIHFRDNAGAVETLLNSEIALARRMIDLQTADPRLGFEASNQYYYVPTDLMEKILNCTYLRDHWLADSKKAMGVRE